MYHPGGSPFGGWRHHLSPASGGTITRAYCRAIYEESVSRCFILPPLAGEVRRSRKGGGERSEPIRRILCISYDTESQSRNADFISIALRAIHHLQRQSRCCPLSEANTTLLHNPRRQPRPFFKTCGVSRHHNPRPEGPSNLRTLRTLGAQPRQPSRLQGVSQNSI